jgi:hypothetical protein
MVLLGAGTALALAILAVAVVSISSRGPRHVPVGPAGRVAGSGPPPPIPRLSASQAPVERFVQNAIDLVTARDRACRNPLSSGRSGRGSFSQGTPPAAMLAAYAVLRRPASTIDHPSKGRVFTHGPPPGVRDVYVRYIRRAQYRYGGGYYLIPAGHVLEDSTPVRCYAEERAALRTELPRIPQPLRAATTRYQQIVLANQRYRQLHPDGICLMHLNDAGFGGGGCGALYQQERTKGLSGSQGDIVDGLVPNGPASITFDYPAAPPGPHPRYPARRIVVPVINNTIVFKLPGLNSRLPNGRFINPTPTTIIWRAANGTVLKTFHPVNGG